MNRRLKRHINKRNPSTYRADIASRRVINLVLAVIFALLLVPSLLHAQNGLSGTIQDPETYDAIDPSGFDPEDAVQRSGMENEMDIHDLLAGGLSGYEPEDAIQLSGFEDEPGLQFSSWEEEAYDISGGQAEFLPGDMQYPPPDFGEGFDLSPDDGEPAVTGLEEDEDFMLPLIVVPDFAEIYDISPVHTERAIFSSRPWDPFYEELISDAPAPDISLLGPISEIKEEGIDFTDVAADWIYHQKSAGLTELRGHVMIIYDTTIITCDEATLDEVNEFYRFFGEGRVFVDDADFTLECDELEIHDAEDRKMIYILGRSTMVVYTDEDAEEPGEDSSRRSRLDYAFKQQDTTITFTGAEYDYENDIFDAHDGVRFEQSDKYAEGVEFHGENETEYMLFTGNCEFWQQDGQWLYEHRVVEDEESPPSRGDKITRALLSVPTTITCDEAEAEGETGWLELRSTGGDVVYFHQDDKHAECDLFTLWYSDDDEVEETEEIPRNLFDEIEGIDEPEKPEEPGEFIKPFGFGSLRLASQYPSGYLPWESDTDIFGENIWNYDFVLPAEIGEQLTGTESKLEPGEIQSANENQTESSDIPGMDYIEGILDEHGIEIPENVDIEELLEDRGLEGLLDGENETETPGVTLEGMGPMAGGPVAGSPEGIPDVPDSEPEEEIEPVGSISELTLETEELITGGPTEEIEGPRNEIIMQGNVFVRQENGDWLFDYDVVDEEEEDEETVEQIRKWANGSCDYLHIWTKDELIEGTGSVFGEQDNQDGAADFLRYLGNLEMLYLKGNVIVNREGKHKLMSNEAFMFFSTKVFEALGAVRTTVMVDVEEERAGIQQEEETSEEQ